MFVCTYMYMYARNGLIVGIPKEPTCVPLDKRRGGVSSSRDKVRVHRLLSACDENTYISDQRYARKSIYIYENRINCVSAANRRI
jgi:hypothetical protein